MSEPFKQPLFRLMVSHTVPTPGGNTRDRVSFLSFYWVSFLNSYQLFLFSLMAYVYLRSSNICL